MKRLLLLSCLTLGLCVSPLVQARDAAADLKELIGRVQTKIAAGAKSTAALAPELAEFDALLVKHPEKNDDTARIALMKAVLYLQVLGEPAAGREMLLALQTNFAGTKPAASVNRVLEQLDQAKQSASAHSSLVGQPAPDLTFTWSDKGDLTTLSALKGKVVVLDFWATWCGPCISSFPQVRELTAHYRGAPVVVLGVTSLQGRVNGLNPALIDTKNDPAREMALMRDFMKAKEMTWSVAFSEQPVFNPDYGVRGIPYVAIIAPDGTVRHAGLHPGSPLADKTAKIDAILQEFKLLPGPRA